MHYVYSQSRDGLDTGSGNLGLNLSLVYREVRRLNINQQPVN